MNTFTSNAWAYVNTPGLTTADIAGRLARLGFDGFDLMIGPDAFPALAIDAGGETLRPIREAAPVASVVLVGFPLSDEAECARELRAAPQLCATLGTRLLHLLPRKVGITHDEGWRRFARLWPQERQPLLDAGLTVTVENHAWFTDSADRDIFQVRTAADFDRVLDFSDGEIRLKFDCSWLLRAGDDPLPALDRLLPHVEVLDLKDYRDMKFVTPGSGLVDFAALAMRARRGGITRFGVEVEEHHFREPLVTDAAAIDALHAAALPYYRQRFGAAVVGA